MIVGCPKETKAKEHRVGIVPASARALVAVGHTVLIEKSAGTGSGIRDQEYLAAGAEIVARADEIWSRSRLIVKVKEPLPEDFERLHSGQIVFTFLHLAAEPALTRILLEKNVSAIAYETIQVGHALPLLRPMSEVAGRMSIQVGAWCLENDQGGKGMLLGGVTGVSRGRVAILGGGVVGLNAAKMAVGMGADVAILDTNLDRLEYLDDIFAGRVQGLYSTEHNVAEVVTRSDLIVGAVLVAGARTPKLVGRDLLRHMQPGSVIVDVAVDQGGCVETMRRTTHDDPIFIVDGVVHYGVANMPGAVARTSTFALANATLPYIKQIAERGLEGACMKNPALSLGLNTFKGCVTFQAVAQAHGLPFVEPSKLM